MSESLRPLESSSIDEGLRIRLEGGIELLEDALPLLDSVASLLGRDEPSRDDVETLQECVTQLPRIDEALDQAHRHEQATELTRAVGGRKQAAHAAANERLRQLGVDAAPSLRGALALVLDAVRRRGTAPGAGERVLATSKGAPVVLSVLLGFLATWTGYLALGSTWGSALAGAVACVVALYVLTPSPWVLLPDRLYFPAQRHSRSRQIAPGAIEAVVAEGDQVSLRLPGEVVELHSASPGALVSMLALLRGPWLAGLASPAGESVVLDAVDEKTKESGRALLTQEGVLFVPTSRTELLLGALTSERLPTPVALDEVLVLLGHLPAERWAAVGAQLSTAADARWLPRGAVRIDDSANSHLGAVVRAGGRAVRLVFSWKNDGERQVRAEGLLARLKA